MNAKQRAELLLTSTRAFLSRSDAQLGNFFRREMLSLMQRLREALQADNVVEIEATYASLDECYRLLRDAGYLVEKIAEFLHDSSDVSQSLTMQAKDAIQATEQAMRGESWDQLDSMRWTLSWLYYNPINKVRNVKQQARYLEEPAGRFAPTLKQQFHAEIEPLWQALRGDSWETVAEYELTGIVNYPAEINDSVATALGMLESLQPSEKPHLIAALGRLDNALQGDSWDQVMNSAKRVKAANRRFGYDGIGAPVWAPCVRILAIDGGGMRGIIPATILDELERLTGRRTASLFDVIVGTSTGGILALGLTTPSIKEGQRGLPLHEARELVSLYKTEGSTIFRATARSLLGGVDGPKYDADGIEAVLKAYLGEKVVLGEALTNVVIPAYELENRKHFFLHTYADEAFTVYMWEVARAASAAPTYFPPYRIPRGEKNYATLIDGGVFANNPTPYALRFAREHELREKPNDYKHPLLMLSLGTGRVSKPISYEDAYKWGILGWIGPLLDIMFSDSGIDDDARRLVKQYDYYFRLQPELPPEMAAGLDNTNPDNIQALESIAKAFIEANRYEIDRIKTLLLREKPKECQRRIGVQNLYEREG